MVYDRVENLLVFWIRWKNKNEKQQYFKVMNVLQSQKSFFQIDWEKLKSIWMDNMSFDSWSSQKLIQFCILTFVKVLFILYCTKKIDKIDSVYCDFNDTFIIYNCVFLYARACDDLVSENNELREFIIIGYHSKWQSRNKVSMFDGCNQSSATQERCSHRSLQFRHSTAIGICEAWWTTC